MRRAPSYFSADPGIYKITNFLSLIPAAFVMPLLSDTLAQLPGIPAELSSPLAALATGFIIYDVSRRSTFSNGYRRIAVAVPILALAANILVLNSLLAAGISLLIGAVLTVYGYKIQQRCVFVGGVLAILTGMLHQLYQITHYFDMGNWATLAIAGILAIVIASIIESKGLNLKNRFRHIKTQFNEWEK